MKTNLGSKKRILFVLFLMILAWIVIIIRISIVQIFQGEKWREKTEKQQYVSRYITAGRGTIYDATKENVLAQSSSVETVTINPTNISKENKEKVANVLSEIFELEYEKVLKKINKNSSIETIVRRVDKEKTNKLRKWMEDNSFYVGINIDEDAKRFYPFSTLASQVIGFVGSDNQGLDGIEAKYNEILTGENGTLSKILDAKGNILGDEGEKYEKPIQGKNLILTIDMNIQAITEKYLEEACIDNECTDGGNVIIMDPNNRRYSVNGNISIL